VIEKHDERTKQGLELLSGIFFSASAASFACLLAAVSIGKSSPQLVSAATYAAIAAPSSLGLGIYLTFAALIPHKPRRGARAIIATACALTCGLLLGATASLLKATIPDAAPVLTGATVVAGFLTYWLIPNAPKESDPPASPSND
jgi:hypothetical protein